MMKWHELLRQERQSRRWTQSMLAEKVGTAKQTIIRLENGHAFPHPYYREKLTTLFGINFEEIDLFEDIADIADIDHIPPEQAPLPSDAEPVHYQHNSSQPLLTPAAQPQLGASLVQGHQPYEQQRPWAADQLFPSEIHPPMKRLSILRPFYRLSRRPAPIGSILLVTILLIGTIVSGAFIGQTFRTSTSDQANYSPSSFILTISTVDPSPADPLGTTYEAQAPGNTLAHGAIVDSCTPCPGGLKVRYIVREGTLQFNNVMEDHAGNYTLTIYYINVDAPRTSRTMDVTVNGEAITALRMPG